MKLIKQNKFIEKIICNMNMLSDDDWQIEVPEMEVLFWLMFYVETQFP